MVFVDYERSPEAQYPVAIEQAYLTTTSLPNQLEARLGRFLSPFGKQNLRMFVASENAEDLTVLRELIEANQ